MLPIFLYPYMFLLPYLFPVLIVIALMEFVFLEKKDTFYVKFIQKNN